MLIVEIHAFKLFFFGCLEQQKQQILSCGQTTKAEQSAVTGRVSAPCSALLVLLKGVSMKSLVEPSAGATVCRGGH